MSNYNKNYIIKKKESYLLFLIKVTVKILSFLKDHFHGGFIFISENGKYFFEDVQKEDFIPVLFNLIHQMIRIRKNNSLSVDIEIRINKNTCDDPDYVITLSGIGKIGNDDGSLILLQKTDSSWKKINDIFKNNLYLSDEDLVTFDDRFTKLKECDSKIVNGDFPSIDVIDEYLNCFISLSIDVFSRYDIISQDEFEEQRIVERIMNFGLYDEKNQKDLLPRYSTSIYNPISLEALRRIYSYIYYYVFEGDYDKINGEFTETLMDGLFVVNIFRAFRRYTSIKGKNFVISFDNIEDELYATSFETVGSIEYIRPIRLFEKIYKYIEENKCNEEEPLKIAVIGYTYAVNNCHEIKELIDYYYDSELFRERKIKIEIDWLYPYYMEKNKADDQIIAEQQNHCSFNFKYINTSLSRSTTEKIIENYKLIFFLDIVDFYSEHFDFQRQSSMQQFAISLKNRNYAKEFERLNLANDLYASNIIKNISRQWFLLSKETDVGYCKWGRLFKSYRYDHLCKLINENENDRKTGIIYVSSDFSLRNELFVYTNALRKERYNSKEINIIKMHKQDPNKMKQMSFSNMNKILFTFTLWTLIKNIDITFKDEFIEILENQNLISRDSCSKVESHKIIKLLNLIKITLVFQIQDITNIKTTVNWIFTDDARKVLDEIVPENTRIANDFYTKVYGMIQTSLKFIFEILFSKTSEAIYISLKNSIYDALYGKIISYEHAFVFSLICNDMLALDDLKVNQITIIEDFPFQFIGDQYKDGLINKQLLPVTPSFYNGKSFIECITKLTKYTATPSTRELLYSICRRNNVNITDVLKQIKEMCKKHNYTGSVLYKNVTDMI